MANVKVNSFGVYAQLQQAAIVKANSFGVYAELEPSVYARVEGFGLYVELGRQRAIVWTLGIAWDGTNYVDESARLITANGEMRLVPPGDSLTSSGGIVDAASLTLQNRDGRYSPLNSDGPLYTYLQDGGAYHRPVFLSVSTDGGNSYSRVFAGVIKIPVEVGPTYNSPARVTIECRSRDELVLSARASTSLADFVSSHDTGQTEATIIRQWLEDAGIDAGDIEADGGFFVVPWAWLDDESPLAEGWALAAASGGRLYTTPDGKFRYENAAHWLGAPHDSSQATLTAASAGQFRPRYADRELYSSVSVEVAERAILESGEVWAADEVVVVPPDSTISYTARLRQPAYALTAVNFTAITSGGVDITDSVEIVRSDYAQRSVLTITNNHASHAAHLTVLTLTGQAVNGRPGAEVVAESGASFWATRTARTRTLRGNAYIQTPGQAEFIAEFLRDRYQLPRLTWQVQDVPGVPARRLGDRLTLHDSGVMSAPRDVFVTGIGWTLGSQGFRQQYEAVDAVGLYPYADTEPGYFVIGTSTLKSAESDRIFY